MVVCSSFLPENIGMPEFSLEFLLFIFGEVNFESIASRCLEIRIFIIEKFVISSYNDNLTSFQFPASILQTFYTIARLLNLPTLITNITLIKASSEYKNFPKIPCKVTRSAMKAP